MRYAICRKNDRAGQTRQEALMTQEGMAGGPVELTEICTTELCTADPDKIRIVAQAAPSTVGLLPYIAAAIPRASYSAEIGYVSWKEELMTHSIFTFGMRRPDPRGFCGRATGRQQKAGRLRGCEGGRSIKKVNNGGGLCIW